MNKGEDKGEEAEQDTGLNSNSKGVLDRGHVGFSTENDWKATKHEHHSQNFGSETRSLDLFRVLRRRVVVLYHSV